MNHRCGRRFPLQVDVLLRRGGVMLGEYKTRDLSTHGAFLLTGEIDLHLGALIEITFILTENPHDHCRVKGMLVRRSAAGIGVMFADLSHQVMQTVNPKKTMIGVGEGGKEEHVTGQSKITAVGVQAGL